jgi:hypothetical protein
MIDKTWEHKMIVITSYRFHNFVQSFCQKNKLTSFDDFLMYKHNGIISETYQFLYTAPMHYLVNSKAFNKFYKRLDIDFRNDIIEAKQMSEIDHELQCYPKLVKALHRIMKGDSRYVYKNA